MVGECDFELKLGISYEHKLSLGETVWLEWWIGFSSGRKRGESIRNEMAGGEIQTQTQEQSSLN